MKNTFFLNAKIALVGLLFVSIFVASCKEEEEADDPNIVYRSVNKSVTSVTAGVYARDSFDLNGDTRFDFYILAAANVTADTAIVLINGNAAAIYIDSTEVLGATFKAKNLFTNQAPDLLGTKDEWSTYSYAGLRRGTEKKGYAGVGDVFIPIIFTNVSLQRFYGWLRVNVTSDYRTVKVVDAAYHTTPDTPIKMGAK